MIHVKWISLLELTMINNWLTNISIEDKFTIIFYTIKTNK